MVSITPFFYPKMRLDLYLKSSRLISRRTLAQEFCAAGLVRVNGVPAKSSREVKPGDEIEIRRSQRQVKIRVLSVPAKKQVSRQAASDLFEIISDEICKDSVFDGVEVELGGSIINPNT